MADPGTRRLATIPRLRCVTCEHASNVVPARWRSCFDGARGVLGTHRGIDRGAAGVARRVARRFGAPIHLGRSTRLVVDLNRSPGHPRLFSLYTRSLPSTEREAILDTCYHPYRTRVIDDLRRLMAGGDAVFHLSVHSFTPVLRGRRRRTDLGLLYDPARPLEAAIARRWRASMRARAPRMEVRRNHPYRGTDDGFMTTLRALFPARRYAGIELEINQKHLRAREAVRRIAALVNDSLAHAMSGAS